MIFARILFEVQNVSGGVDLAIIRYLDQKDTNNTMSLHGDPSKIEWFLELLVHLVARECCPVQKLINMICKPLLQTNVVGSVDDPNTIINAMKTIGSICCPSQKDFFLNIKKPLDIAQSIKMIHQTTMRLPEIRIVLYELLKFAETTCAHVNQDSLLFAECMKIIEFMTADSCWFKRLVHNFPEHWHEHFFPASKQKIDVYALKLSLRIFFSRMDGLKEFPCSGAQLQQALQFFFINLHRWTKAQAEIILYLLLGAADSLKELSSNQETEFHRSLCSSLLNLRNQVKFNIGRLFTVYHTTLMDHFFYIVEMNLKDSIVRLQNHDYSEPPYLSTDTLYSLIGTSLLDSPQYKESTVQLCRNLISNVLCITGALLENKVESKSLAQISDQQRKKAYFLALLYRTRLLLRLTPIIISNQDAIDIMPLIQNLLLLLTVNEIDSSEIFDTTFDLTAILLDELSNALQKDLVSWFKTNGPNGGPFNTRLTTLLPFQSVPSKLKGLITKKIVEGRLTINKVADEFHNPWEWIERGASASMPSDDVNNCCISLSKFDAKICRSALSFRSLYQHGWRPSNFGNYGMNASNISSDMFILSVPKPVSDRLGGSIRKRPMEDELNEAELKRQKL
jgi:hypothetical protein